MHLLHLHRNEKEDLAVVCLFVWARDGEFNLIRAILTAWRQLIASAYLKRK